MLKQLISVLVLIFACTSALADSVPGQYGVVRTLVTGQTDIQNPTGLKFGGCMALIGPVIQAPPQCFRSMPDRLAERMWVTFSCDGTLTTEAVGKRMLDTAHLADVLDKRVVVYTNGDTINQYCFADRIDIVD